MWLSRLPLVPAVAQAGTATRVCARTVRIRAPASVCWHGHVHAHGHGRVASPSVKVTPLQHYMEGALALTLKRAKHAAHGHEHLPEAERLFKAVITCQRPALGDQHHDTIASIGALSHVLKKQHKLTEALPLYREVAAYHRATSGGTDPETLHHIFELAELLKHQHHVTGQPHGNGDDLEAEALYREVIKGRQAVLGYTNSKTMETIKHLAVLLRHMPGRHAEAEQLMIEVEGT